VRFTICLPQFVYNVLLHTSFSFYFHADSYQEISNGIGLLLLAHIFWASILWIKQQRVYTLHRVDNNHQVNFDFKSGRRTLVQLSYLATVAFDIFENCMFQISHC